MDHDDFVAAFGAAIEADQASVLVGAGLSRDSGYPGWAALIQAIADEFNIAVGVDLPMVAQYIENEPGGRGRLLEHVVASIASVAPTPGINHVLLCQLPIRDKWTTNYDPLIEAADDQLEVIEQDSDFVARRAGVRRLHKMHGSIPAGAAGPVGGREQLVITRDDYEKYERTHPRFWRLLQGQFLTTSFLFVGFSLTDPNFEGVFRLVRLAAADKVMPHFAIMRRPPEPDKAQTFEASARDLERVGISTVTINDHEELTALLRRLVARTLPPRLFVAGSYRTTGEPAEGGDGTYPTAPASTHLSSIAEMLGEHLAQTGVPGIVAAGDVGATVGYAFLDGLKEYDHSRFTLIRRQQRSDVTSPSRRRGQISFTGDDPSQMRGAAFERVRAVAVIGGTGGTLDEVGRAEAAGMSVIPIASSGGAARTVWDEMMSHLDAYRIGQQPIDRAVFADLNSPDVSTATKAAAELIVKALFLPSGSQ